MAQQKWEYLRLELPNGAPETVYAEEWSEGRLTDRPVTITDTRNDPKKVVLEVFGKLGELGWEAVGPLSPSAYIFKRPAQR